MASLHHLFQSLLAWIHLHPNYGESITFAITFSESIAIIGLIVPGSFLLAAIGGLIGSHVLPLWPTLISATCGAIVGDSFSFGIGYYWRDSLANRWPFRRYPHWLKKGQAFFERHGGKSVFIGRFMGPLRPITPLVAGTLRMPYRNFLFAAMLSAWIWAPAYMIPGFLLGAASLAYPHQHFVHIALLSLLAILLLGGIVWMGRVLCQSLRAPWSRVNLAIWKRLGWGTTLLQRNGDSSQLGQLNLAWWIAFLIACFGLLILALLHHNPLLLAINHQVLTFFQQHRTPGLNNLLIYFTCLGTYSVLGPAGLVLMGYLLLIKQRRLALHWLLLIAITIVSIGLLKHVVGNPRPIANVITKTSYSFPSGHSTLITCYFMFWILIINQQRRFWQSLTCALLLTMNGLICFSRLYLGAHWASDVAGGILFGLILANLCWLSLQRQPLRAFKLPPAMALYGIAMFVALNGYYVYHLQTLQALYQPLPV